jgi:hypothetical protein
MLKSELIKRISAQNPHLYDRDMALHIKPHEGKRPPSGPAANLSVVQPVQSHIDRPCG